MHEPGVRRDELDDIRQMAQTTSHLILGLLDQRSEQGHVHSLADHGCNAQQESVVRRLTAQPGL